MRVRPLPGLHFNVLKDGKIDVCKEPPYSESCQRSTSWLDDVITVSNDLFIGQQFTRIKHPVAKDLNNILPEQPVVSEVVTAPPDKKAEKDKQKPDAKKKH
jgi:hypothetical protein